MTEFDTIPLDAVRINGGTQSRAELNQAAIADYTDTIRAGTDLPPVVVFFDGATFWLADGFHRFHAHKAAGAMEISAEIRTGTQRDAILFSVGANASHGLRRTNEDKRRAVTTLLNDPEWAAWSDREIANQCGVSHSFVAAVRSPVVAIKQQENRQSSALKTAAVESDSTRPVESDSTPQPAPFNHLESKAVEFSEPPATDELTDLRDRYEEMAESFKATQAENEMMGRAFDADDKLKAAMDEAARQKAIAESAERTLAAKNGEFVARAEAVTYWKNRAEKAEKALKAMMEAQS